MAPCRPDSPISLPLMTGVKTAMPSKLGSLTVLSSIRPPKLEKHKERRNQNNMRWLPVFPSVTAELLRICGRRVIYIYSVGFVLDTFIRCLQPVKSQKTSYNLFQICSSNLQFLIFSLNLIRSPLIYNTNPLNKCMWWSLINNNIIISVHLCCVYVCVCIPANGHGYYNRLPAWAENLLDLRALSGHHHPQRDKSQEDQTHRRGQVPYIWGGQRQGMTGGKDINWLPLICYLH